MRRALLAAASVCVAILATSAAPAQAPPPGAFSAFGPRIFQNAPGFSVAQTTTFTVLNPGAPYHVRIRNGALVDPQYTSAFSADVLLNGAPLLTFEELNKKAMLLDKPVTLTATNELSVTVHGRPNALIEIEFLGQDVDDPLIVADVSPSPNAAGWHNSDVTVTFTCSDATSEIASCPDEQVVTIDGTGIVVSGTAVDAAGRTAVATVTLNVDRTPPQISIGKPTDGSVSHAATVAIEGAADDSNGVAAVTCSGAPALRVGDTFTCPASLGVGPNTLYAEAMDVAGNPSIASVGVTRDPDFTAPSIAITSPAPLALFAATTVTVTGTVDDPDAVVDVNGRPATLSPSGGGATFTVNDVSLKEGSNLIAATAKDSVDNSTTVSLQVVRDTIPPVVTIENPADGTTTIESSVVVTGMINEMVVGTFNNEQGTVIVNGAPASVENRTFAAPGVQLAIGPNTITAIGTDRAGNSVTAHATVTRIAAVGRRIETLSGNGQNGIVSAPLANPLAVIVKDETGNPVSGATVIFRVVENNGALTAGIDAGKRALAVATDATGRAEAAWTLGSRAGASNNRVEAYSVGYEGTAIFTAGAASGTPSEILVDAGNAQTGATGQKLPRPLVVVVADAGHNRIEGTSVTFTVTSGGASFDGQASVAAVTDGDGRAAAIPTLGSNEGVATTRIQATFAGNAGPPVTFIASSLNAGDAADTTIAGVVLDNANTPVPGATVKIQGTILQTITSPQGQFKITGAPVGEVLLIIDGATTTRPGTWPMLAFDLVTVAGRENTVGMPIYLLPLDVANGVMVDETHGGTVTLAEIPGFALEVAPNSATFLDGSKSGRVHVTAVHTDKVPMLPSFGSQPRLTVTIQPMGIHFDPPARLTVPNFDSLPPGSVTDMYSFDHDLGQFVGIGTGTVSEDGTVVRSDPGVGVVKGGWHWAGPPTPVGDLSPCFGSAGGAGLRPDEDSCCQRTECQSCVGGAPVDVQLGPVEVTTYVAPDSSNPVTSADTTQTIEAHADLELGECSDPHYEWNIPGADIVGRTLSTIQVKFQEFGQKLFKVKVTCGSCGTGEQDGSADVDVNQVIINAKFRMDPSTSETPLVEDSDPSEKEKVLRTLGGVRLHLDPVVPKSTPAHPVRDTEWSASAGTFYDGPGVGPGVRVLTGDLLKNPDPAKLYWQGTWDVDTKFTLSVKLTLEDESELHGERAVLTRTLLDGHKGDDVKMLQTALHLFGHSSEIRDNNFGVEGNDVPLGGQIESLTAASIALFQFAATIRTYPKAVQGQPPPPPPPTPPANVDATTITEIGRQWADDFVALAGTSITYFQAVNIPNNATGTNWFSEAATLLGSTYTPSIHNAVSGGRPYAALLHAWIFEESSYGHWGYGSKPYRMTMGTADPAGSVGFSQVIRVNKYGPGAVTDLAGYNLYDPHQNVLAFAVFSNAAGQGFQRAFGDHSYDQTWARYPLPNLPGTTGSPYADDDKDRLSKALRAYNSGPGALPDPWPILLMKNLPPPPGTSKNGARYSLEIQRTTQIPLRTWVWTDQAIVADAVGTCSTTTLRSGKEGKRVCQDERPPHWTTTPASTPYRVCIVPDSGCKLYTAPTGHESIREFRFKYSEGEWLPPARDAYGVSFETKRDGCIPNAIASSPSPICP